MVTVTKGCDRYEAEIQRGEQAVDKRRHLRTFESIAKRAVIEDVENGEDDRCFEVVPQCVQDGPHFRQRCVFGC